jgi:hypothetical protein
MPRGASEWLEVVMEKTTIGGAHFGADSQSG